MAFSVTDTIVAGRFSDQALAVLSVGSAVYVSVFVALMGVLQALLPVWAELHGAGKPSHVGQSFRQALYLCGFTIVIGIGLLASPGALLRWTEVPEALWGGIESYLAVLAMALPPALLFRMYSTLNQSLGRPLLVTALQIGSLFVKVPLSIWFTFGGLGLQPQGAVGCAWATLVVNYGMFAVALWMVRTRDLYRPFAIWQAMEAPKWRQIADFARLGVPGGLCIMVEVTSFTLMALFVARLGTLASGSHQIVSNLAALLFMVPLSISIAASARVSYWRGAGNLERVRSAIRLGFKLVVACALFFSGLLFFSREIVVPAYTSNPDVVALTLPLLTWVVVFHLFDGLQALCVFVLRCFRVAIAPLVVYTVLLWGGGLGGGYMLAYHGLGPWPAMGAAAAFWIASTASLGATAAILGLILFTVAKRELRAR